MKALIISLITILTISITIAKTTSPKFIEIKDQEVKQEKVYIA